MREVFQIKPLLSPSPIEVFCQMEWKGRTYLQSRFNKAISFEKTWSEYKSGFGTLAYRGDFWLGNEKAFYITNSRRQRLQIQIWNGIVWRFMYLTGFRIGNETENFKLDFDNQRNATNPDRYIGDCMTPLRNAAFSTPDRDNDGDSSVECGVLRKSGWWFRGPDCAVCNPNGYMTSNEFRTGNEEDAFWTPTLGNKAINKMFMVLTHMSD